MDLNSVLSVHNLAFLEALQADYERDPSSVPPEWVPLLSGDPNATVPSASPARSATNGVNTQAPPTATQTVQLQTAEAANHAVDAVVKQNQVNDLIESYRLHGHLGADVDPLGKPLPVDRSMLEPVSHGLEDSDMDRIFHTRGLFERKATLREILSRLKRTYCRRVAVEYWHLPGVEERLWLQKRIESCENEVSLSNHDQMRLFNQICHTDNFDKFLSKKFLGAKRFSIAGSESTICLLDSIIEQAACDGTSEVVVGMAHRGRLSVLMETFGKTPYEVFCEFEDTDAEANLGAGDVKYHMGYHRSHTTDTGREIYLALAFNPSHLEAITPVIQGRVRAKHDALRDEWGFDGSLGVTLHGDAAFAGQGVVPETLNLSRLEGYSVGGSIRIIINNQIGFTTDPSDSRSGLYCTDVAHGLQVPVFHINGDDPEAAAYVGRLAVEYRKKFHREVIIDLNSYRRFGHNEGDEPAFTQPQLYDEIKNHRGVRQIYQERLIERGTLTVEKCAQIDTEMMKSFDDALVEARKSEPAKLRSPMHGRWSEYEGGPETGRPNVDTTITPETVTRLGDKLFIPPEDFQPHPKLKRMLGEALTSTKGETDCTWATAELLAYSSLVEAGVPVRISGQDSIRGTFSHRHAKLTDPRNGDRWSPIQEISDDQGQFEIYNSPLSEFAVLGFEFGYSLAVPEALVIWEAQFGDFANGAQVIIDQFLTASEDKWNRISGLVMMLPHGYEGQGPEHSSARLERFLQMCAEDNLQIINPTCASQMFHALRRQVLRKWRKPLIVMSPKSLLRFRPSFSPISDFTEGTFQRVIDDKQADPSKVTRVLLCSGRQYYDLLAEQQRRKATSIALVRVEQLYPFPSDQLRECIARYSNTQTVCWVQDEPENMGAWRHVAPYLCDVTNGTMVPSYAGRPASASPATGSANSHRLELQMILKEAFDGEN